VLALHSGTPSQILSCRFEENWEGRPEKISYVRDKYRCDVTERSGGLLDGMLPWILHPPGFQAHVPNIAQTVTL